MGPLLNPYPLLGLSSDIPSDAETSSIRAYINDAEAAVHILELELILLLAKRTRIISHVRQCRLTIAPYKKLPVELITEIIRLCIPEDLALPVKPGKQDPRLVVTQVCATWRAVAFNTPELWPVILPYPLHDHSINLADAWIRQCSSSRLQLRLENPRIMVSEPTHFIPKIINLITPYSRRFESLALEIQPGHLNSLFTLPFDNLEKTTLRLNYTDVDKREKIELPFCGPLPSLQSVIIKNIRAGVDCLSSQLPLSQLTQLSLTGHIDAADIFRSLAHCTSLQRCCLCNVYIADLPNTRPPLSSFEDQVIYLPHLQSLAFGVGSFNWTHLLYSFRIPNLLWLKAPIDFSDHRYVPFLRHIPNLRHYIFRHDRRTSFTMVNGDLLSSIPNAVTLLLPNTHSFDESTLTKIGMGELLPKIRKLECGQQNLQFASKMMISRQAKARELPGIVSPITEAVSFIMSDDIDKGVLEAAIKDMFSQGLSTKITRY